MKREEFDNLYNVRNQLIRYGCKSCKYYNIIRDVSNKINGKCSKMVEMDVDSLNVNALKGCDLFEYDLLKPIDKSLSTIKGIVTFYLIITLIGVVIFFLGIGATL